MLVAAISVRNDEFGMAEVLDESDRVAEGVLVATDLDDGPAVDSDLQVEGVNRVLMGVTITFDTHEGSVAHRCHRVSPLPDAARIESVPLETASVILNGQQPTFEFVGAD